MQRQRDAGLFPIMHVFLFVEFYHVQYSLLHFYIADHHQWQLEKSDLQFGSICAVDWVDR